MSLVKSPGRIHGTVKFTCPICEQECKEVDVSIPATDVGIHDLTIESLVVVADDNSPTGVGLRAELVMECSRCNIRLKQFVRVAEQ
jgi:hypothetical protein